MRFLGEFAVHLGRSPKKGAREEREMAKAKDQGYRPNSADALFGTPTGRHSHPATHPYWMEWSDWDCPVCGSPLVTDEPPYVRSTALTPVRGQQVRR